MERELIHWIGEITSCIGFVLLFVFAFSFCREHKKTRFIFCGFIALCFGIWLYMHVFVLKPIPLTGAF